MSSENPLVAIVGTDVALAGNDDFSLVAAGGAYLPRLQLLTSASDVCKSGEFPMNHYARVQDSENRDLGDTVDVLVIAWRPFALEQTPEGGIIVCYDAKSDDFARIQAIADRPGMNGSMYGPQFLVWVPSEKEYMTFAMTSKTARRASATVKARMVQSGGDGKGTLGSKKIDGKEFTWFGPTCQPCSTPFEMPAEDECRKQMLAFANPPAPEVTKVAEDEAGDVRE